MPFKNYSQNPSAPFPAFIDTLSHLQRLPLDPPLSSSSQPHSHPNESLSFLVAQGQPRASWTLHCFAHGSSRLGKASTRPDCKGFNGPLRTPNDGLAYQILVNSPHPPPARHVTHRHAAACFRLWLGMAHNVCRGAVADFPCHGWQGHSRLQGTCPSQAILHATDLSFHFSCLCRNRHR